MKKIICLIFLFMGLLVHSQELEAEPCASDQLLNSLISINPEVKVRLDQMDQQLNNLNDSSRSSKLAMITIPVVIYVVHDNQPADTGSNISDNQVNAQLSALNTYFNSYGIQFCLATKNGTSPLTYSGVISVQNTLGIIHINKSSVSNTDTQTSSIQALVNTAGPNVTPERFLRIWVVKSINGAQSGIKGYSVLPNTSTIFDGIVMCADVFGNGSSNLLPNYNQGKSLVHEVGHYLGLYHTFNEACSGMDQLTCGLKGDRVCDTPPTANQNFYCFAGNSCHETPSDVTDAIHNYMDYGNNPCMTEFSTGQKQRMLDVLTIYRSSLFSTDNLINAGVCGSTQLVSASFAPNTYMPCHGNSVTFNPIVTGITYSWNFGDTASGVNNTSSLQNPSHVFSAASTTPYIVTLTINNGTTFSTAQIYVSNCTPSQNSEINWCFPTSNGLNFSSGAPVNSVVPFINTMAENCAVQSNASGNLLFYTNGVKIWNASHALINGSTPLFGNESSRNGTVIVPHPGNTNQYFVFTKSPMEAEANGFRYSIVNIGTPITVPPATANRPVTTPSGYMVGNNGALLGGEGIAAAERCSGLGYWIITTAKKSTGQFMLVYSLNASGILTNVSSFDLGISTIDFTGLVSSVEISPNGNKIAFIQRNAVHLMDFNKYNGTISNKITILNSGIFDGGSFSPNSNLFYTGDNYLNQLYQFNVNNSNPIASKLTINNKVGLAFQKGPDNKVYFSYPTMSSPVFKLGVIHQPNNLCSLTDLNACHLTLGGPIVDRPANASSLPNMVDAKITTAYNNTISSYPTSCNTYNFFPNACGVSFNWNFGDISSGVNNTSTTTVPTHVFSANGTYTVTLRSATNVIIATTTVTVGTSTPVILGSDRACATTNNITNNSVVLQPGQTATWSVPRSSGTIAGMNNQSDVTVSWVTLPAILTLTVTDAAGCSATVTKTINNVCACDCLPTVYFTSETSGSNTIDFQAQNSSANPACANETIKYRWIFGDGTSFSGYDPTKSHTYSTFGTYNVSLEASVTGTFDEALCTSTPYTGTVTIEGMIFGRDVNPAGNGVDQVTIYPNPNKGNFTVQFNSDSRKDVSVSVHDISGRKIFDKKYTNKGLFSQNLQLDRIQAGVYLVTVQDGDHKTVKRIVVE